MQRSPLFALLLVGLAFCTFHSRTAHADELQARAYFECNWWSAEQMIGMNPNRPPPKTTRTRLKKWEYSDPIGVPHPDKADLVVEVEAGSTPLSGTLNVLLQWKRKTWSPAQLQYETALTLAAHQRERLVVPVDLAPIMRSPRPSLLHAIVLMNKRRLTGVDLPIVAAD